MILVEPGGLQGPFPCGAWFFPTTCFGNNRIRSVGALLSWSVFCSNVRGYPGLPRWLPKESPAGGDAGARGLLFVGGPSGARGGGGGGSSQVEGTNGPKRRAGLAGMCVGSGLCGADFPGASFVGLSGAPRLLRGFAIHPGQSCCRPGPLTVQAALGCGSSSASGHSPHGAPGSSLRWVAARQQASQREHGALP